MGLAKPYFDRSKFDGWSHDKMVDAYIGVASQVVQLKAEIAQLKGSTESRETWYSTGQPMPYTPADGQW